MLIAPAVARVGGGTEVSLRRRVSALAVGFGPGRGLRVAPPLVSLTSPPRSRGPSPGRHRGVVRGRARIGREVAGPRCLAVSYPTTFFPGLPAPFGCGRALRGVVLTFGVYGPKTYPAPVVSPSILARLLRCISSTILTYRLVDAPCIRTNLDALTRSGDSFSTQAVERIRSFGFAAPPASLSPCGVDLDVFRSTAVGLVTLPAGLPPMVLQSPSRTSSVSLPVPPLRSEDRSGGPDYLP